MLKTINIFNKRLTLSVVNLDPTDCPGESSRRLALLSWCYGTGDVQTVYCVHGILQRFFTEITKATSVTITDVISEHRLSASRIGDDLTGALHG